MYKKRNLGTVLLQKCNFHNQRCNHAYKLPIHVTSYYIYNAPLIVRDTNSMSVITTVTTAITADVGIFSLVIRPTVSVENTNLASMVEQLFISEKADFSWNNPLDECLVDVQS